MKRHFVTIGKRQLQYRRAGSGPPILLLHRIPRTSESVVDLISHGARFGTVIAPDLPGYGASDGLNQNASLSDYADAVAEFLDALGVANCVAFGEQAGAAVLARAAARDPRRFSAISITGISGWDKSRMLFPPFVPEWDGSHFARLWAFLREESCFSPWHRRTLASRIFAAMPDTYELHRRLVQIISSRDQGRSYAQLADHWNSEDLLVELAHLSIPLLIVATNEQHNQPVPNELVGRSKVFDSSAAALTEAMSFLAQHVPTAGIPAPPPTNAIEGLLASRMIDVPGGQLHARFNLDAGTTPLVVQHDAASSTTTVEPIVRSFIGRRNVLAFDMPGSGKSDNIINSDHANVQDYSDSLAAALDEMDLDQIDFYGMWGGGFVGSELSFTQPHRVRRLVMSNLFFHEGEELKKFQNNYTPPIEPAWHGGHLLQCWHQMRDQGLFFPWFDRSLDGIIRREPFLDVDMVHDRVCSLLQAGNMYRTAYQAHFVYPVRQRLRKLNIPTLLATTEWDPNRPHTEQLAAENRHCQFQMLSPDFQRWGISFLPFLEHR